jgi:hypothetical protein
VYIGMNKLVITALLALSATAIADAPRPPPVPLPTPGSMPAQCTQTGGVLFEAQTANEKGNTQLQKTYDVTIYAGGAWTRTDTDDKGHVGTSGGCWSDAQMATLKANLAKASWTVEHMGVACDAFGAMFTTYRVKGKEVWADHVCQEIRLDTTSEQALAAITKLVDTTTPHLPPCCKK